MAIVEDSREYLVTFLMYRKYFYTAISSKGAKDDSPDFMDFSMGSGGDLFDSMSRRREAQVKKVSMECYLWMATRKDMDVDAVIDRADK